MDILKLNKIASCGTDCFDTDRYNCCDECENPDAILVRSANMHEMDFKDKLLAIGRAGAGTNNIPIELCSNKGIAVFNTPGANANAVKELVVCAALLSSRKIAASIDWCKTLKGEGENVGKLVEKGKSQFKGPEIKGKTMGVIGLGAIGELVANAAVSLGMRVIGYDPFLSVAGALNLTPCVNVTKDIDEVYKNADYITLHVPATPETTAMICKQSIEKMKTGARILNFARGTLVNTADIIEALKDNKLSAYITDFPTDDLIGAEGVTVLPHLGASTPESEDNCAVMAAHELIDYLETGAIKNSVNLPDTALPASFKNRVCVIYKDEEGVQGKIMAQISKNSVSFMTSSTKKGMGYLAADTTTAIDIASIEAIEGVVRVRTL